MRNLQWPAISLIIVIFYFINVSTIHGQKNLYFTDEAFELMVENGDDNPWKTVEEFIKKKDGAGFYLVGEDTKGKLTLLNQPATQNTFTVYPINNKGGNFIFADGQTPADQPHHDMEWQEERKRKIPEVCRRIAESLYFLGKQHQSIETEKLTIQFQANQRGFVFKGYKTVAAFGMTADEFTVKKPELAPDINNEHNFWYFSKTTLTDKQRISLEKELTGQLPGDVLIVKSSKKDFIKIINIRNEKDDNSNLKNTFEYQEIIAHDTEQGWKIINGITLSEDHLPFINISSSDTSLVSKKIEIVMRVLCRHDTYNQKLIFSDEGKDYSLNYNSKKESGLLEQGENSIYFENDWTNKKRNFGPIKISKKGTVTLNDKLISKRAWRINAEIHEGYSCLVHGILFNHADGRRDYIRNK